jgi:hypothetical protein
LNSRAVRFLANTNGLAGVAARTLRGVILAKPAPAACIQRFEPTRFSLVPVSGGLNFCVQGSWDCAQDRSRGCSSLSPIDPSSHCALTIQPLTFGLSAVLPKAQRRSTSVSGLIWCNLMHAAHAATSASCHSIFCPPPPPPQCSRRGGAWALAREFFYRHGLLPVCCCVEYAGRLLIQSRILVVTHLSRTLAPERKPLLKDCRNFSSRSNSIVRALIIADTVGLDEHISRMFRYAPKSGQRCSRLGLEIKLNVTVPIRFLPLASVARPWEWFTAPSNLE